MSTKPFQFSHGAPSQKDASHAESHHGEAHNNTHEGAPGHPRQSAKGHAAYAARDGEAPSATPRSGFGAMGGLFTDDAAGPVGHGVQAQAQESNPLATVSNEELFAECQMRICPECPVKKEADDSRLRSLAEMDNARKRLAREREEQVRFASEAVLADIVPSLDNLDLALQHAGTDAACKNFVVGVQMTRKLLLESLQKHGLEVVGAVGEEFNPAAHEAVGMADAPEVPEGYVCGLLSCGYKLKERLLRPARVMVCKRG